MGPLSVAVAVALAMSLLNLLLCLGIVRRLREHSEAIARSGRLPDAALRPAGDTVGPFTAATTAGEAVSRDDLGDVTLVGFFSSSCAPCRERIPEFVRYAAGFGAPVLSVVSDDGDGVDEAVARLEPAGRVVVEPAGAPGALSRAFGVAGYPALGVVGREGEILVSGTVIGDLPAVVHA
jgi:thiol-disulfide isomerase/thioredoxin